MRRAARLRAVELAPAHASQPPGGSGDFALVSGADARYFPLLHHLVRSIRRQPLGREVPLRVIDLGLSPEQRETLEKQGVVLAAARNDFGVEMGGEMPQHVLAFLARPWLPEYFPGFELYLWIDADTFVQEWSAMELYLQGARTGALAVTPEVDRAYRRDRVRLGRMAPALLSGRITRRRVRIRRIKHWAFERARFVYPKSDLELLVNHDVLNSGVFALRSDAPHWEHWRESFRSALAKGRYRTWIEGCDQLAMNHAVRKHAHLPLALLPSWCNWSCFHALPAVDAQSGAFVEPCLPHARLGIVHATGMSVEEALAPQSLVATDGSTVERALFEGDDSAWSGEPSR